jgi:tRNA(Ile)-lysidine synthase
VLAAEAGEIADNFSPAELKALFNGLAGTTGVAIAVSGGSDSMALLHLVLEWRGLMKEGPKLVALTVDHGLRAESATEAKTVAAHCARLKLEHNTLQWEGSKPSTGIQAKARAARYDLMTEWCRKNSVGVLLTAHTAEDQAETVLMRARRTGSAASLAGIWPERQWGGIRVLRPVLSVRRPDLRRYLLAQGVRWIEDPSNENERFERVRARRQLAGRDVPDLVKKAELAQEKVRAQSETIDAFVAANVTIGQWGDLRVTSEAVLRLESEELVCLCRRLVKALRGQAIAERAEFLRLAEWLADAGRGRRTLNGLIFQKLRSEIAVGREPGRIALQWQEISGRMVWDQRFVVTAPPGSKVGPALLAPDIARPPNVPFWLHQGLPVVELPTGQRILTFGTTDRKALEQLGIAASRTYVNALEGFPVA